MVTVKRHSSGLSDSEYLDLLKKLVKEQYDEPETFESQYFETTVSFRKASRIKEAINKNYGVSDFSKSSREEIVANIFATGEIKVGPFCVKYCSSNNLVSMYLQEEKVKSFAGKQGKITERVNMFKDNRFNNKDWMKYFNKNSGTVSGHGREIPIETFVDIIKFLQLVYLHPSFL